MNNPLLDQFTTPFATPPFSAIKNEHFLPAIEEALKIGREEIARIRDNPEEPNLANVTDALDKSGERLEIINNIFFNLYRAETNGELQRLAQVIKPKLVEYHNDIMLDQKLFAKVKAIYCKRKGPDLGIEAQGLVTKQYRSFVRSGALLGEQEKAKLRQLDQRLADLTIRFGDNVLADTKAYKLVLTKKEEVAGLPVSVLEAAQSQGKESQWVFTLDESSYFPFMKYAKNRALREKLFRANGQRGYRGNDWDNREVVKQIVDLRRQRAKLLGYASHAHYQLEESMAQTPERVDTFLQELLDKASITAKRELQELQDFASSEGLEGPLQPWDFHYYSEKLKKVRFGLDDETLRPYFQLDKVIQGAFAVAQKLYGISFRETDELPIYHSEVKIL